MKKWVLIIAVVSLLLLPVPVFAQGTPKYEWFFEGRYREAV
ncbi:hypothetical protein [Ancylothrix sp. D3o]|nr:hypothetical protein [Ancylothrix sp. D3o]